MGGWLENVFLKKTASPKFGLESQLGTFDFGVCQNEVTNKDRQCDPVTWSYFRCTRLIPVLVSSREVRFVLETISLH